VLAGISVVIALCFHLGGGCGDAGFAVVLPDAAAGGDGVCVHFVAFDGDYIATGRGFIGGRTFYKLEELRRGLV